MAIIYKPQNPITKGEDYIYPLTTADQVILTDGSRLEKDGLIQADRAIDSDTLDGLHAEDFASATDVEQIKTQIGEETVSDQINSAISSHTQAASTITAGTFAGEVIANSSAQTPETSLLRNSALVSADTTPTNNGEICWLYE